MSDTDFEREILKAVARMEPGRCVLCKELNNPNSNYCGKCGLSLKDPLKFGVKNKELSNLVRDLMNSPENVVQVIEELVLRIKKLEAEAE